MQCHKSNRSYAQVLSSTEEMLNCGNSNSSSTILGINLGYRTSRPLESVEEEQDINHQGQSWNSSSDDLQSIGANTTNEELNWILPDLSNSKQNLNTSNPVELFVTGLNQHLGHKLTKSLIVEAFTSCIEVLSVQVFVKNSGNISAKVKVPSEHEAQYAISQLQGYQIGGRRIHISIVKNEATQWESVRSNVAQLLAQVPQNKIPVFLFREMYEAKYLCSISVSELNRMKDVCFIADEENRRMIYAKNRIHSADVQETGELPYCLKHSTSNNGGLAEQHVSLPILPNVKIGLKCLNLRIHSLLQDHDGKLPLHGLLDCYKASYGPLQADPEGIPLEHLVSCIHGVEISQSQTMVKYLKWVPASALHKNCDATTSVSPMLLPTVAEFTKEIVELLMNLPKCLLQFSQFIPEYHRRFGKQCRVSDYGFTKLLDLLESLPHIVQVIGVCQSKVITLCHQVQVRRFTYDLLKIIKNRPNKQILVAEIPWRYYQTFNKILDPVNYGVCELDDLLESINSHTIHLTNNEVGEPILTVPRREPSREEIDFMKQFSKQVLELLKQEPECCLGVNKLIGVLHRCFGRSLTLDHVVEWLELMSDSISITGETKTDKIITLSVSERLKVVGTRLINMIIHNQHRKLHVNELIHEYRHKYKTMLDPADYGCNSFEQLFGKLSRFVMLEHSSGGPYVVVAETEDKLLLTLKVRRCFLEAQGQATNEQFIKIYSRLYNESCKNITELARIFPQVILLNKNKLGDTVIQLTNIQLLAHELYWVVVDNNGTCPINVTQLLYRNKYNKLLYVERYGFKQMKDLVKALPETFYFVTETTIGVNTLVLEAGFTLPGNLTKMIDPRPAETRTFDLWNTKAFFSSPQEFLNVIRGSPHLVEQVCDTKIKEVPETTVEPQEKEGLIR